MLCSRGLCTLYISFVQNSQVCLWFHLSALWTIRTSDWQIKTIRICATRTLSYVSAYQCIFYFVWVFSFCLGIFYFVWVFSILFGYFLFCVTGCRVWTSSLTWHQEAWNESTPTVMWPHRHQTQHRWRHHTCASNVSVSLIISCDNYPRLQCNLVTRQQKGLAWFDKKESMYGKQKDWWWWWW